MMTPEAAGLAVILMAALAEWLHSRRIRSVAHLAFGPSGAPRPWTRLAPALRALSLGCLVWGLATLYRLDPKIHQISDVPEGGYRHLLIVLDVSPSMQIRDSGPAGDKTRAQRASELLLSTLERIVLKQAKVSIVGFYTGAKRIVVDTSDLAVVKNALNDLPFDMAFDIGKTTLMEGVADAVDLAARWQPESTTMILVSDGDAVPDTGMPTLPRSIQQTIVAGVGNPNTGTFIDGHMSRQDVANLRLVAGRLRGTYHDGNQKHLPSDFIASLAQTLPMRQSREQGLRELALAASSIGALLGALLPLALAFAGSPWQSLKRSKNGSRPAKPPVTEPARNEA